MRYKSQLTKVYHISRLEETAEILALIFLQHTKERRRPKNHLNTGVQMDKI